MQTKGRRGKHRDKHTHSKMFMRRRRRRGKKKKKVCIYITAAGFFNNLLHFWPRALLCSTEGRNKSDWLLLQVAPLNYSFTPGCLPIISLMPSHAPSLSLSPPPAPPPPSLVFPCSLHLFLLHFISAAARRLCISGVFGDLPVRPPLRSTITPLQNNSSANLLFFFCLIKTKNDLEIRKPNQAMS